MEDFSNEDFYNSVGDQDGWYNDPWSGSGEFDSGDLGEWNNWNSLGGSGYDFSQDLGEGFDMNWNPMNQADNGQFQTTAPQEWIQETQNPVQLPSGGSQDFLGRLFSNPTLMAKGIGALFEGQQNKKRANDLSGIAQKAGFDPFGSQRPFYQQQLQQAVQNPYVSPIVANQANQLAKAQAIKDAAAGRRSSNLASSPGVLAAQAQIAQQYMNSLMTPAGANIRPESAAYANMLNEASKADTNGYISPLLSVLGNMSRGSNPRQGDNTDVIQQIQALLNKG